MDTKPKQIANNFPEIQPPKESYLYFPQSKYSNKHIFLTFLNDLKKVNE